MHLNIDTQTDRKMSADGSEETDRQTERLVEIEVRQADRKQVEWR